MQEVCKIPSKVMLMGEYAVLGGAPAFVAAIPPYFEAKKISGSLIPGGNAHISFHPGSPAGKLLRKSGGMLVLEWQDPHQGRGGFGGSTAEFIAVSHFLFPKWSIEELWQNYRSLFETENVIPSGVDLVAQKRGGLTRIQILGDPMKTSSTVQFLPVTRSLGRTEFWVLSAVHQKGRKVKTHEALAGASVEKALHDSGLRSALDEFECGWNAGNALQVGNAMKSYAQRLSELGLEVEQARRDREALSVVRGVLGVKGCGAGLSDVVLMCVDVAADQNVLSNKISDLNLELIHRSSVSFVE